MKQYVIDELRPWEYEKIRGYLSARFEASEVDGIYWIHLDTDILNEVQRAHTACQPHCFAVELEPNRMSCELLVRTRERIRCECISYATEVQRNWLIRLADDIFDGLGIIT
jgi:hypothetical protein